MQTVFPRRPWGLHILDNGSKQEGALQACDELAAEDATQDSHGQEESVAGMDALRAIQGEISGWGHAVDVKRYIPRLHSSIQKLGRIELGAVCCYYLLQILHLVLAPQETE
jgi:hypothetical protein